MADFDTAFNYMMDNEDRQRSGVVTSDPTADDPKAIARFGINSAAHPEAVAEGFYNLPSAQALLWAEGLYKCYYWLPIKGYKIICQDIANKYFDLGVNEGCAEATKIIQRASNQVLKLYVSGYLPVTVDGICGPETLTALNQANPEELLPAIKAFATQFYKDVAFREKWPTRQLSALLSRVAR